MKSKAIKTDIARADVQPTFNSSRHSAEYATKCDKPHITNLTFGKLSLNSAAVESALPSVFFVLGMVLIIGLVH